MQMSQRFFCLNTGLIQTSGFVYILDMSKQSILVLNLKSFQLKLQVVRQQINVKIICTTIIRLNWLLDY